MRPDKIPENAIRETYKCCFCGFPVQTYWASGGGMYSSIDYVLVGDLAAHGTCYDKHMNEVYEEMIDVS